MSDLKSLAKSLGAYTAEEAHEDAFARVLILGPYGGGKTTAVITTAPAPVLVLNADGDSSLNYAATQTKDFVALDIATEAAWNRSTKLAEKAAKDGQVKSIVLDTVSLLSSSLVDELSTQTWENSFKMWGHLGDILRGGIRRLLRSPAHVFIICHMDPTSEVDTAGILPMIAGSVKGWLPATVQDRVLFEIKPGRTPHERVFLVGAQEKWGHGCRNAKRSCVIPADVGELLKELRINP